MEKPKKPGQNIEHNKEQIRRLIEILADKEEMSPDHIESDIMTFAVVEGNEDFANPEYFEELAERLKISLKEILNYAEQSWKENNQD